MAAPMRQIIFGRFSSISVLKRTAIRRRTFTTSHANLSERKDIRKLFLDSNVQSILKRITGFDLSRINAPQLMDLQESQVQLLTDEQLLQVQEEAKKEAGTKMMMPPVMDPREEVEEILVKDEEIAEAIDHKMVFTDITFGIPDRERIITVRETEGTLRTATWSERERMHQIYFPLEGQKLRMPKMFLDENLQLVLEEGRYFYAMERACLQFEPDDPTFIKVTSKIYDHIHEQKLFDSLRSSRHFGPMAFYFARHKNIDQLVIYFLHRNEIDCAADTVRLLHILNPGMRSAQSARNIEDSMELLEVYCEEDSVEKGPISLLLQSQMEQLAES